MKVLFVANLNDLGFEEPLGILYLSSYARQKRHNIYLVENKFDTVNSRIMEIQPDLLAFSVLTPSYSYLFQLCKLIKEKFPELPTVFGGPHATFFPEIIEQPEIGYVFRGECESVFADFLHHLEDGKDLTTLENLVYLRDGAVIKNPLPPLITNLDDLPFPDRELLKDYKQFYEADVRSVIAGRGCPFRCSYCFNAQYQTMYGGLGKELRVRSVDNVVQECKELKERYKAKMIHFFDDIFPFKKEWVDEFAGKYSREVGLPFLTNTSFSVCTEHYISALRRAGCKTLLIGVEIGNEYLRDKILHRPMKNDMMMERANLIHSYGIKIYTQNILGIPHGSLESDIETLRLNIKLKADYAGAYLCHPYPGTLLEEIAREAKLLDGDPVRFNRSFYYSSNLKIKEKKLVEKLRILFPIIVNYPFLLNFIYLLLKLPAKPLGFIGLLLHGYKIKVSILRYNMGLKRFFEYLVLYFKRPINRIMVLNEKAQKSIDHK